ncbi:CIA30 family protein [Prochlorococcus sp. MIT 0601]|uniref:CIA30 family protein n=1 Tax=Prochlorococcus sp. MIT 0601 TaxID=1499498 RepID=UPI0023A99A92|nr:CIA30 family protein [Prochlorococcus sp. MIT 0601]
MPFSDWTPLNDTIMGGASQSNCEPLSNGLLLKGFLIEENGGFVSCRSPVLEPPLDLSPFKGIEVKIDGYGRTLKFAISCKTQFMNFMPDFYDRIKWVAEFKTQKNGTSIIRLPFEKFQPTIRTRPVTSNMDFRVNHVNQFQLLYSKFGMAGKANESFLQGPIQILLRCLSAYI